MQYKEQQMQRFSWAETSRFQWQTGHPYVSLMEKKLLETVAGMLGELVLEVGCGEAANIVNFSSISGERHWIGGDFSLQKISFCKSQKVGRFLCADALNLPFKDNSFDTVFARDLLHHVVDSRATVIQEMIRVCRRGGKIILIEANGRKLIYKLFSIVDRSEMGLRYSNPQDIRSLLERFQKLIDYNIIMCEPSVLFRAVFHYKIGICKIGFENFFIWLCKKIEQLAAKISAEDRWGYIVVVTEKR